MSIQSLHMLQAPSPSLFSLLNVSLYCDLYILLYLALLFEMSLSDKTVYPGKLCHWETHIHIA